MKGCGLDGLKGRCVTENPSSCRLSRVRSGGCDEAEARKILGVRLKLRNDAPLGFVLMVGVLVVRVRDGEKDMLRGVGVAKVCSDGSNINAKRK